MGWEIDAGPLHFSRNGVAVKPQLKVGYADDNVNVRAGVEDVRNGLSAALAGQVHRTYESEGNGMNQVLRQLKSEADIRVLDDIISAVPKLLSEIMRVSQVKIADDCPVHAKMTVKGGVGISGAICLGWANTEGFHMVGVQGSVSVAAGVGGDMLVGTHAVKPLVKCILGVPNVCIDLVFEHNEERTERESAEQKCSQHEVGDVAQDAMTLTM